MKEDILELDNRRKIYQIISKFPGMYMREMEKVLGLAVGVLEYHLSYMVKSEILSIEEEGNKKRYFIRDDVSYGDKITIGLLRQKVPRRIVVNLMLNPGIKFKDVLEEFEVSKSTLSFHMKKLVDAEIVTATKEGRETSYIVRDPEGIARVILTYKASFLDSVVDRFAETWMELNP